jgi:hypothetical protein
MAILKSTPLKDKSIELGGSLLTQGIATALANRPTSVESSNMARLERLQRLQDLDMLGLTEAERGMLESQYAGQLSSIGEEGAARRAALSASFDTMGASALEQAALTDRALAEGRAKATAAITEADLKRRADQESELLQRSMLEQKRLDEVAKGRADLVTSAGQGLLGMFTERREEEGALDPALVEAFRIKLNLPDTATARKTIKSLQGKPDLFRIISGAL